MDPGDYVRTADGSHVVCLFSKVDARCADVWDTVLAQFVAMGATSTSANADAWRIQHDSKFHHEWAVLLPCWAPSLAYYVPHE